jgi:hypothetical protein
MATVFVIDQLVGPVKGNSLFPFLHLDLTENFGYRGLWGTLLIILVIFITSAFTKKTEPAKLEKTTINWSGKIEPLRGLSDWRLQWIFLALITVVIYWWLW